MEDYRLMQFEDLEDEEEEDEEGYDDEEHEEDLTPVGITPPRDLGFILDAGEEEYDDEEEEEEEEEEDDEDEDEEEYEEGEEGEELIPLARVLSAGSIEDGDYEDEDEDEEDEDYEDDEEEDDEDYEDEELIPVETMSPRVSSSISHGTTLQGPVLINEGLLDDSESREGKPPENQSNTGGNGGKEELNIEGFFCPICFEAWTSGGEHQICCLPCGHLYGLSCIKKWLHQRRSSGKCPLCNNLCTLKDVTVIYGSPVCIADEEFQKARIDDVIESFGPESVNAEIFTQAAGTARRGWVRGLGGDRLLGGIDTNPSNMAFYGATRDDSLREEIERFKQDVDARFHEFDARIQALKAEVDAWPAQLEAYIQSQMETMWHAMQSWQQQNQVRSSSLSSTPPGSPTVPPFVFSLHPPSFRFPRQLSTPVQPPPYPPPRASQYPPAPPPYYPQYPPASPQ